MATLLATTHHNDIEQGRFSHRRSSVSGEYSDEDGGRSSDESCTVDKEASSSSSSSCCYLSECSVEDEVVVDIESGGGGGGDGDVAALVESSKVSVHLSKIERDCRICHLSLDGSDPESGLPIELGCCCKGDLAVAHKHCAEAWFKIRGNRTCEICGSIARNVVGVNEVELVEQWTEANDTAAAAPLPPHPAETRHFWQGHRFLNFLLACMVFAFVISWLFHFNVPS
ncbi:hypothetical protein RND81_10G140700 [Saponaria officinalis]|uniref:RING-CH-type domain-containing protein n=1 Tax=Saponaria officinalis TaxID=3572 RepID=A0AAW1I1U3_SAPOF